MEFFSKKGCLLAYFGVNLWAGFLHKILHKKFAACKDKSNS